MKNCVVIFIRFLSIFLCEKKNERFLSKFLSVIPKATFLICHVDFIAQSFFREAGGWRGRFHWFFFLIISFQHPFPFVNHQLVLYISGSVSVLLIHLFFFKYILNSWTWIIVWWLWERGWRKLEEGVNGNGKIIKLN